MESHQSQTWWNPSSSPWQCQGRSSHWLWQGGQGSGPCGHHESQGRARLWGPPGRVTHGTACTETMHCQGYPTLLCTIHIKFRSPTHSLVWNRNKGDLKKQFSLNIWAKTCTARAVISTRTISSPPGERTYITAHTQGCSTHPEINCHNSHPRKYS